MEAPDGSHFSWSNLVEVVKREMAQRKVSVSRLTQGHLNLTSRTKLTVSLASRVFTRRVVRAFEVYEWIENRGMTGGVWNELLQTDFFDNISCFQDLARDLLECGVTMIPVL
jgi:hypothetical protein